MHSNKNHTSQISDDEVYYGNDSETEATIEKRKWDDDINSEKFLNERAPPTVRVNKEWLERGLQMPRLGENDSTNAKIYNPDDKNNKFADMIFDPPTKELSSFPQM